MRDPNCHRCKEKEDAEYLDEIHPLLATKTYETRGVLDGVTWEFYCNVTEAYRIAQALKELSYDEAVALIIANLSETFCGAHVDHVENDIPPIVGTFKGRYVLMDGTHRLFRLMKLQRPLKVYLLNEEETSKCSTVTRL